MTNDERDAHILNTSKQTAAILELVGIGKEERSKLFKAIYGNGSPGIKQDLKAVEVRLSEHIISGANEDKQETSRSNALIAKVAIACTVLSLVVTIGLQLWLNRG